MEEADCDENDDDEHYGDENDVDDNDNNLSISIRMINNHKNN